MERSIRAPEQRGSAMGTITKDREDDLTLFIEMRNREKERGSLLHANSDELEQRLESRPGGSPTSKILRSTMRKMALDDLLNSDSEKSDYDWLLTPPGTPLSPYLEKEPYRSPVGYHDTPNGHPTSLKSRLANSAEPSSKNMATSRHLAPSGSFNYSFSGTRRPSSSGGSSVTSSRPATPSRRTTLPTASKLPRFSTPTSRPTLPSKSGVAQPRSSTPLRSSTPTSRSPAPPASKLSSRSNTPPRRPSTPSTLQASSNLPVRSSLTNSGTVTSSLTRPSAMKPNPAPSFIARSGPTARSGPANSIQRSVPPTNPVPKSGLAASKITAPSRGTSPTVRSRPWKPSEMPGYSLEAPPNLKTTLPKSSSPSRGRPGAPSIRSSSVENVPNTRSRRQSCSPSRGRTPKGNSISGSSVPASNRLRLNGGDSESPVIVGTKMVERVVNSRRLAPPKHDDLHSINISSIKSSLSPDSTGFGRTLSKNSLDMAMRHMDIRRSIPNTLRPLMNNVRASSLYSVRPGFARGRAASLSGSPLATSSNASSEQSVSNSTFCFDGSEIFEHDYFSEKAGRGPPSFFMAR